MPTLALVGTQWGDEGKGKVIDILSEKADMVVRAQGGNNAGHTVITGGITYKLQLIPSGILYPDTICAVGSGVVIDPKVILSEIDRLKQQGHKLENLRIDKRSHIIFPYHIIIDELSEDARGKADIGTTKKGIGPCYMDKAERIGIRICDLMNPKVFEEKLRRNLELKNNILTKLYGQQPLAFESIYPEYLGYAEKLKKYITDTSVLIYEYIKAGKNVLFEGAQGSLLDLDLGTYPYVTSSHPVSGGFCIGAGIGPTLIEKCLGITKAYTTRVGKGPFPTELNDETADKIREQGYEFGTVTGRARRCGWLDLVILRFSVRVNGLTEIALNKLDVLSGLPELKVCTAYKRNGETVIHFPADISELAECEPVYETLPGWAEDIGNARSFAELPANAQNYIRFVEKNIECKISMIGIGPNRDQNITVQ